MVDYIVLLPCAGMMVWWGVTVLIRGRQRRFPHLVRIGAIWIIAAAGVAGIWLLRRIGLLPDPWCNLLLVTLFASSSLAVGRARRVHPRSV